MKPDTIVWTDIKTNLECMARWQSMGFWCGYVRVPWDNGLWSRGGDDLIVHGGVTFAGKHHDREGWWIGFDCYHGGIDHLQGEPDEKFHDELITFKNIDYVKQECAALAEQVACFELITE